MSGRLRIEDGTTWPHPDRAGEIGWRMRYARQHVTEAEMLVAASIIDAYRELVLRPDMRRKPAMIRRALRTPPASDPSNPEEPPR